MAGEELILAAPRHMVVGTTVSFDQMLAARKRRAAPRHPALAGFAKPLVSLTVVPSPLHDGWLRRRVMAEALRQLDGVVTSKRWSVLSSKILWQEPCPEALFVMDVDARLLKWATVELEDQHSMGRLWDLDVIAPGQGRLSRRELGFPARRCLICEKPAHACSRSRPHPPEELWKTIREMVQDYDLRSVA